MKELIKKVFAKKLVTPIFVVFGFFGIFNFIVFPGLTTADTGSNIISALFAVFTLVFIFYYIDSFKLMEPPKIESGETELDYINPDELTPKKKRNPKQSVKDGVDESAPFVKTRKKKVKKSEFPMEPHHSTLNKTK
jgi:hypothetical protein